MGEMIAMLILIAVLGVAAIVVAAKRDGICEPAVNGSDPERLLRSGTGFDRYVAELVTRYGCEAFPSKVAGVTHFNLDGTYRQNLVTKCKPYEWLTLEAEPDCPYDHNAVRVLNRAGQQLGYLPRRTAQDVSREMKRGTVWAALVRSVGSTVDFENYGMRIVVCGFDPNCRPGEIVHLPPEPQVDMDAYIAAMAAKHAEEHFLMKVKATGDEERQYFLRRLKPCDEVRLMTLKEDPEGIIVCTLDYGVLGYLLKPDAKKLLKGLAAGESYSAFVHNRDVLPGAKRLGLLLVVMRLNARHHLRPAVEADSSNA